MRQSKGAACASEGEHAASVDRLQVVGRFMGLDQLADGNGHERTFE